jgi:Lon protease-like protein
MSKARRRQAKEKPAGPAGQGDGPSGPHGEDLTDGESSVISVTQPGAPTRAGREPGGKLPEPSVHVPRVLAIMPIRQTVMFPGTVMPLNVGRDRSRRLLSGVLPDEKVIGLVTQRRSDQDDPTLEDLYTVGTASLVLKLLKVEEGGQVAIVHGVSRFRIERLVQTEPFYRAEVSPLLESDADGPEIEALVANLRQMAARVFEIAPNVPDEARTVLANLESPGGLADFLAANMPLDVAQNPGDRLGLRAAAPRQPGTRPPASVPGADLAHPGAGALQHRQDAAAVLPPGADEGHPQGAGRGR